jgi:probable rRNA maturation factor
MIIIRNQQRKIKLNTVKLKTETQIILKDLGYQDFDLFILLVNEQTMQGYNRDYRNQDKPTDILSFPFHPELSAGEQIMPTSLDDQNLGDIIICPNYILNDLSRWEKSFDERMQILLVHGICHLLGYDHIKDSDYEIMKKEEARLLARIK